MRKILFLFSLISYAFLFSQNFSWVKQFKSYTDYEDDISKMAKDSNGNIYLLGRTLGFSGIDADPGPNVNLIIPTNYSSSGTYGTTFVIKVDSNGNYLWSHKISEMSSDYEYDLKVKNGKVYALTSKSTLSGNIVNGYVTLTVLDTNGNLLNETQLLNSTPNSLEVDNNGNVYLSTFTFSNLVFSQPINAAFNDTNSSVASYVIKFNPNLQVDWLKKIPGGMENKLALNSNNDVYFAMNDVYGPGKYTLFRYNTNGNLLWSGTQAEQRFSDIVVDKNDKLIVSGQWQAQFLPIDVDPSSNQYLLPSNTYISVYLLWFDTNNNLLDVKKYLNSGQNFPLSVFGLSCDDNNDLHINGTFNYSFDANPDLGTNTLVKGSGYIDGCSISFDTDRVYKNSFKIGSANYNHPNSVSRIYQTVNYNDSYYYIGLFDWNCDFDPSASEYFLNSINGNQLNFDGFLLRLDRCNNLPQNSSMNLCLGSTIQLNASGGTTYLWTGPNGFTSNQQNPTIPNSTTANSGIYTCQVSGSTNGCDGSFSIHVIVGDITPPVPNATNLPNITGDCHTTVTNIPTATDNCAGAITATTTDPLSYSIPGTYVIHWIYEDNNGNISAQNQNVIITSPALPTTLNTNQTFCATNQPKISDIQITGQNIKWYDAANNILPATTPLVNGQTYYASQTINGCEGTKIAIQVTVNTTPKPIANATQDFCASANPTIANLAVNGTSLIYYNAAGTVLPITTPLVHGQTYFVTQTLNGCESEKSAIAVTLSTNNVPAHDYSDTFCNSTTASSMVINLTSYEDDIITNPTNYTFTYTDALGNVISNPSNYVFNVGSTVIHVKVMTPDGCFIVVRLSLTLNPKPTVNLPEKIEFCKGKTATLDAGSGFSSYLWSTGATTQTITVSTPGNYSVMVKNSFGCEATDNVQVSYSVLAEIVSINVTNNSATVLMSATGNYEYSLDNFIWQDSNVFNNLEMGEYTVYVRTKAGCIIGQKSFSIFNIPNAISPNGDGRNDKWKVAGLENYLGSEVNVYDRRGTPVFKQIINKKPLEWDGKLNGNPVPTGNYWYTIKVSDGRVYTGWLLIKNRD
ncbi:gliding motility-associated C-terminal domain-containing protein [Chryseobacterium soldanellicola]|uniref:Gliding motility-associated C-terminal domain-containing protein n=1 Tax=Chryseobacterium soldanellicola TaxID=311333 RepID=A0A1H1FZM3_9FLAO|nr:T9SS type B sorting domain-containing protein [Chryseobacterium soldanellicola]SDR06404.1 gliding motility-associated C-terminal domain-containing protein [Chryseobacterium soldanellicola]